MTPSPSSPSRREHQVLEIAALVVAGCRSRAEGLALEHAVEFPEDADLLAEVVNRPAPPTEATSVPKRF